METDQTKKILIVAVTIAIAFHLAALYMIGSIGISGSKQSHKILIPVTMQIKPLNKANKPKIPVLIKHIRQHQMHPVKTSSGPIKTGHNKFLASSVKANHGFSVPSGGNIRAGTILAHQGSSATSTAVANNIYIPPIPIFNPMPVIPHDLRVNKFSTYACVEFFVNKNGSFKFKLLCTTGYDELDRVVINTLNKWKFTPATRDNEPVNSTLKLRIRFSVK